MKRLLTLCILAINLIIIPVNLIAEPRSLVDGVIRFERSAFHRSYVGFYDPFYKIPTLVYYVMTNDDVKSNDTKIPRPSWKTDTTVMSATTQDYTNSGYDRGHMAPDADFSYNKEVLALTYMMSNVAPQLHGFNAGVWLKLENRGRVLAAQYGKVLIVSGPTYAEIDTFIHGPKNMIAIPLAFYKVFVYKVNGDLSFEGYIVPHDANIKTYENYFALPEEVAEQARLVFEDISPLLD